MTVRPVRIILSLVALLSSSAALAATASPPPIVNRVLDLLADTVVLNTNGTAVWESAPFGTSQFEWIGLHVSATSPDGIVSCQTAWRYTTDEDPVLGAPSSSTLTDRNFPTGSPLLGAAPVSSVLGLEARIVCRVELGSDPVGDPPQATGTIKDVKVLLRRF